MTVTKNVLTNLPYRKYVTQRKDALRQGIGWYFTLESWVKWWETKLGPNWITLRGRGSNQYQMARKGDKGPYAAWNVECKTAKQNIHDRNKNGRRNLPDNYHQAGTGPAIRNLAKIEKLLLEGFTVHAVAKQISISSKTIYQHYPKGVRSVMQKHGIKRLTVTRYRRDQVIEL